MLQRARARRAAIATAGGGIDRGAAARRGRATAVVASTITAAILAFQLLVPPIVGLANEGDFEKIMGIVGLKYLPGVADREKYFRWVHSKFVFVEPWWDSEYRTSETILVRAAMIPARWHDPGVFDLRWLAALHAGLFLVFFASILRDLGTVDRAAALAGATAAIFFYSDVGYVSVMNSFYSQEASYLALFAIVAVLARASLRRFTVALAVAYFVAAAFFVTSKPQEIPAAGVLALFGAAMMAPQRGAVRAIGAVGAAALLGLGIWSWGRISPSQHRESLRQVLFDEVLANSPDARRDLRELRLDPAWAERPRKSLEKDPRFWRKLTARFSFGRLATFYVRHPERAIDALRRSARAAMVLRPPAYGNLPRSSGVPEREPSHAFGIWSAVRSRMSPVGGLVLLAVFGGAIVAAVRRLLPFEADRIPPFAILLLVSIAVLDFSVCSLANSHTDIERHLFAFDAITDLLIAGAAAEAASAIARRRSSPAAAGPAEEGRRWR